MPPINVVFAHLENLGYMAGVSMERIYDEANKQKPIVSESDVRQLTPEQVPTAYQTSAEHVLQDNGWHNFGVYLLIQNFEEYASFKDAMTEIDKKREDL
ncbi:MAG: hypothetical protein QGG83_04340 [Candidatus Woesearchaeota archaeon]|jgi:hypothetical protein|nr:hypothetical protein [Candidatus Woesearchaeota archaeon]MDP7467072.1 hypothetical protein [Candidatus Woesearchaeota archaeon]|tara:strand:- start:26 stop:322 length:297 start_codon:yes stop_codon:yes gene_type:complete